MLRDPAQRLRNSALRDAIISMRGPNVRKVGCNEKKRQTKKEAPISTNIGRGRTSFSLSSSCGSLPLPPLLIKIQESYYAIRRRLRNVLKQVKMLSPVISVVVLLLVFFATNTDGSIFNDLFNPGLDKSPKFSDSQLYLLQDDDSVGIDDIDGYIGCFGDFNSDK